MSTALTTTGEAGAVMEQVVIQGDLEKLTPEMRVQYYLRVCESVGLNPYTKPFDYIRLNGKLTLYALKGATDQLRRIHGVSAKVVSQERIDDVLVVTVEATDKSGRVDVEIGAVSVGNLKGDALANALMKALTKAKRRVTLSICGLGMLDESEVETIPTAQRTDHIREVPAAASALAGEVVDEDTGEIVAARPAPQNPSAMHQATEKQLRAIFAVGRDGGWQDDEIKAALYQEYGLEHTRDLTVSQASEFIDYLRAGGHSEDSNQPPLAL